jgi:hypothetical protein
MVQNRNMAAADHVIYPARPVRRGPEKVLLDAAVSVFHVGFGVLAIVLIVAGVVSGSAAPVVFGILVAIVYGSITWNALRQASWLEFSSGRLSWRCSLPWSPRMRPGRVQAIRWPASRRSRYVRIELDDGRRLSVLPGPGLMEFINSVRDVEPAIVVDVRPDGRKSRWMSAEPPGYIQQRVRAVAGHHSFRILFSVVVSFLLLGVVAEFGLTLIGAQENFQTLRSDLAKVHLPSGYRLAAKHQAGTDCAHEQCSLTQTWTWTPGSGRTKSAACSDVYHAMTSAFSDVEPNAPVPANAACDYFTVLSSLLHPGQGKRTVEAIVQTAQAHASDGFLIKLIASYG